MIEVETGIPIPSQWDFPTRNKYPFRGMEIGDSFFVKGVESRNKIRGSVYSAKSRGLGTFKLAPENDGFRVWRIA